MGSHNTPHRQRRPSRLSLCTRGACWSPGRRDRQVATWCKVAGGCLTAPTISFTVTAQARHCRRPSPICLAAAGGLGRRPCFTAGFVSLRIYRYCWCFCCAICWTCARTTCRLALVHSMMITPFQCRHISINLTGLPLVVDLVPMCAGDSSRWDGQHTPHSKRKPQWCKRTGSDASQERHDRFGCDGCKPIGAHANFPKTAARITAACGSYTSRSYTIRRCERASPFSLLACGEHLESV